MAIVTSLASEAQVHRLPSAEAGLLEAGVPPFLVRSQDGLGLSAPPADLHLLPDGRLLAYAPQEIAFGDGSRWEVSRQAPGDTLTSAAHLAVDDDGTLYVGIPGGFARVEFDDAGQWRLRTVALWDTESTGNRRVPGNVIQTKGTWLWHAGSGAVAAWRPGEAVRGVGRADIVEHAFLFKDHYYLSDHTSGQLSRITNDTVEVVPFADRIWTNETITCAIAFDSDDALVGTVARGVLLFDGEKTRPFVTKGPLIGDGRINDLCALDGGYFAAAIEGFGLVFFQRDGATVQVLEAGVDHRLAHVRRLVPGPDGTVWGLLADGIVRVAFPSRLSNYEPYFQSPVITAHVNRLNGRLLMDSEGRIRRGVYDESGRLTRLELDSPREIYSTSISTAMGVPVIGLDRGGYFRSASDWVQFAPQSAKLRILSPTPFNGRWLYGAYHEVGWLRLEGDTMHVETFPAPRLENLFNADVDAAGAVWIEGGSGRLTRVRVENGRPVVDDFDSSDGLPQGWAQLFIIDGIARVNIANQIVRLDEHSRRFVRDSEFSDRIAQAGFRHIIGRPGRDAQGRLWMVADGGVRVLAETDGVLREVGDRFPPGLTPYFFAFEPNGVVWMQSEYRLTRYDPALPVPPTPRLRALITHLTLSTSGRVIFPRENAPLALDFAHNALTAHFVALGTALDTPTSFEVMLEGADRQWSPVGAGGSTAFKEIKEGRYILRVRPTAGGSIGEEARLVFSIRPPWYRTNYAYLGYILGAAGVVFVASRISSFLQRRENARLERLVAQRTSELNASHDQLERQVQEIRTLSHAIEQSPIAVYLTQPDGTIVFVNPRGCELSGYQAAELIGLNARHLRAGSLTPAIVDEIEDALRRGEAWRGQLTNERKGGSIVKVRTLVAPIRNADGSTRHLLILEEDITAVLAEQERHRRVEAQLFQAQKIESIGTLAGGIAHDFNNILTAIIGHCELARISLRTSNAADLEEDLEGVRAAALRAKELVAQILTFSRKGTTTLVPLDLANAVTEALKLLRPSTPATIAIVPTLQHGVIRADPVQIQQVVVNLCTNAIHAMRERAGRLEIDVRCITIEPALAAELPDLRVNSAVRLTVSDNGEGMDRATLDRIFDPFFTTKQTGEGTGLGLSIVQGIVAGHSGAIRVQSTPGRGTTFELYFPLIDAAAAPAQSATAPVAYGSNQEIIVVDDESPVVAVMAKRLQQLGYRPAVFSDPRAALEAFVAAPARFQALVTDLTMPHLTGDELLQEIRAVRPALPAVIVTGYGHDTVRARLAALPRCHVLLKPFEGDELARVLGQLLSSTDNS